MADVSSLIENWSTTASSNSPSDATTIGAGLADNFQQIQATVRTALASKGADVASATTTDIGAVPGLFLDVTGTTPITGLGTIAAGIWKVLKFEGALTLTHNATSLILPGGGNITTADGDVAIMVSEGSGNWRCVCYAGKNFYAANGTFTGSLAVTGAVTATGGLKTNVAPSSAWGIDQAQANQLVTIADNGTYDLAAGSGLVIIQNGSSAAFGMFMGWGGNTTELFDPSGVFSGAVNTASSTNFYYNGTTAYRIQNKTGGSVDYYITTIKTRAST